MTVHAPPTRDVGKPLRVLSIASYYPRAARPLHRHFIHRQMAAVARAGCQVLDVTLVPYVPPLATRFGRWRYYADVPNTMEATQGVDVRFEKYPKIPFQPLHGVSTLVAAAWLMRSLDPIVSDFGPDVIHAHGATPNGYIGLRLARRHGLPAVCSCMGKDIHIHPHSGKLAARLTRQVIAGSAAIACNSEGLKRDALTLANGPVTAVVIHRGVDLEEYAFDAARRSELRKRLGIRGDNPVLVFVGRVNPEKGIPELLTALEEVRSRIHDLHLIVVGRVERPIELEADLRDRGLTEAVHLAGLRPAGEIPGWLSAGDVFVLPSRREGMPNALLQAMACERPVVASRVGGIPEAVDEDRVGLLVEPGRPQELVRALLRLLAQPDRWRAMGTEARNAVRRRFSWDRSGAQYRALYESCIQPGGSEVDSEAGAAC